MKYDYPELCGYNDVYIKGYFIKDNNIILNLSNGKKYTYYYNIETEKNILDKMEEQVRRIHLKEPQMIEKVLAVLQPLALPTAIYNLISFDGSIPFSIFFIVIAIGAIKYPGIIISYIKKKREVEKMQYLLDLQDELNKVRECQNLTAGLSKKTIKRIEKTPIEKPVFDINSIDNYSLADLKTIMANIVAEKWFQLEKEEQEEQEKVKVLK